MSHICPSSLSLGYYRDERSKFPYERRSKSRAYVAPDHGDFYYCGGAFGGLLQEVHQLAKTCHNNFKNDAKEGIEAAWQEESHLNRWAESEQVGTVV